MLKEPHTPEETAPAVHGPEIEPAAKPAKKSRHRTLHCRECGGAFQTMRYDAVYCGSSCREKVKVRERSRAAELYQIAMNWRRDRGRGHDEFADLTKLLDRWIGDDREHQATVGGLHEEPAQEIRQVEHNGKIVGQVERVGREWFWRAKSSAARRDTREQWRNRSNPSHAVPLRFRNRKGVAKFATGEAGR
jgi:hypothetical protein